MAACNAVLDLSTTLIGRQRLLEFSGLQRLMSLYRQHRFCYLLRQNFWLHWEGNKPRKTGSHISPGNNISN
ncbi:hypothetical protein M5689_023008 [Euphorbia peplus]|nr:hypothetical protein M5689_023008 [Euphorbia peplus]